MDSLKDLLQNKADKLDIDGRLSDLQLAQDVLDRHFGDAAKAVKQNRGALVVRASSAAAASDIRLGQITVLEELGRVLESPPVRLVIRQ